MSNAQARYGIVAPLVGAWIEIFVFADSNIWKESLPLWERGLKLYLCYFNTAYAGRSPCGSVD